MLTLLTLVVAPLLGVVLALRTGRAAAWQLVFAAVLASLMAATGAGAIMYGPLGEVGVLFTLYSFGQAAVAGAVVGLLCAGARAMRRSDEE